MKYNPKLNEWAPPPARARRLPSARPGRMSQGSLELQWLLPSSSARSAASPRSASSRGRGARGAHRDADDARLPPLAGRGRAAAVVIVPDSAHGTNPATATMVGFTTGRPVEHPRRDRPRRPAARSVPTPPRLMLTNPSTLGIFEDQIDDVLAAVHEAGAIAYMDGANLNAILGRFRAGEAGLRRHALQPAQDLQHAARRRGTGRRPGRGQRADGPVPARAATPPGGRRPGQVRAMRGPGGPHPAPASRWRRSARGDGHRPGAHLRRQLRDARPRVCLHPGQWRRRPAPGDR